MTVMDCDMVIYSPLWFFHGLFPPPRGQGSESSSLRSTSTAWAHSWPSSQVVHTALHSATSAAPMESADCSKPEKHGFLKEKLIELCRNKCQYAGYTWELYASHLSWKHMFICFKGVRQILWRSWPSPFVSTIHLQNCYQVANGLSPFTSWSLAHKIPEDKWCS